jgi:hypothetical protein
MIERFGKAVLAARRGKAFHIRADAANSAVATGWLPVAARSRARSGIKRSPPETIDPESRMMCSGNA